MDVWIEPEWNWNIYNKLSATPTWSVWIEPEWNWNFQVTLTSAASQGVWIEPEWNWNIANVNLILNGNTFESNQSGIETRVSAKIILRLQEMFESNQSGIETNISFCDS